MKEEFFITWLHSTMIFDTVHINFVHNEKFAQSKKTCSLHSLLLALILEGLEGVEVAGGDDTGGEGDEQRHAGYFAAGC